MNGAKCSVLQYPFVNNFDQTPLSFSLCEENLCMVIVTITKLYTNFNQYVMFFRNLKKKA